MGGEVYRLERKKGEKYQVQKGRKGKKYFVKKGRKGRIIRFRKEERGEVYDSERKKGEKLKVQKKGGVVYR